MFCKNLTKFYATAVFIDRVSEKPVMLWVKYFHFHSASSKETISPREKKYIYNVST